MAFLGVTERTLRKWVEKGIAKPKKIPIGKRTFYEFSDAEVARLKKAMRPNWMLGQQRLKRD